MRLDILTLAVILFVVGLFLSSFSISNPFASRTEPAPHQQGFALEER